MHRRAVLGKTSARRASEISHRPHCHSTTESWFIGYPRQGIRSHPHYPPVGNWPDARSHNGRRGRGSPLHTTAITGDMKLGPPGQLRKAPLGAGLVAHVHNGPIPPLGYAPGVWGASKHPKGPGVRRFSSALLLAIGRGAHSKILAYKERCQHVYKYTLVQIPHKN